MFCIQCGKKIKEGVKKCRSCGMDVGYLDWALALSKLEDGKGRAGEAAKILRDKARDEAILASIGDGLIVTDRDGRVLFMNRACEKMIGWKLKEARGKDIGDLVTREDEKGRPLEFEERVFSQIFSGAKSMVSEDVYFALRNKKRIPVSVVTTPIVLGKNIVGAVEIFRDITREKEIEAARSDFIAIASHQLRTPLSAFSWLVESLALSLKDKDLGPDSRSYLDDLNAASRHAVEIVENLLNASRIESRSLIVEKRKLNLAEFIENFLNEIEPYAELKKHKLSFAISGKRAAFDAETDPKLLQNILQNLISNGIDHSPEKTTVKLKLGRRGKFIKIMTSNKSPHIPKQEQKHLFEKFYRGESVQKIKASGFGLGLFVAKSFAEALGGKMGFESKPKKDVLFWFELPYGSANKKQTVVK
jgi:PAS domain S-box-containing protein